MIPVLLATSSSGASRTHAFFCPSVLIGMLTSAMSVSQSFFTTCVIWCWSALTPTVNTSVVLSSVPFMVRGLDDGIAVRFVSSGVLFLGYLGCPLSRSVLGCWKVGDVWIFFSLWMWTPFNTAVLAFKAFAMAAALLGDRGFLLHLQHCLCEKPQNILKSQNNQNLGKKKKKSTMNKI